MIVNPQVINVSAMLMVFLLYAALGICIDYLVARYYQSISRRLRWRASTLSALITLLTVFVLASVIQTNNLLGMFGYAAGNFVGTYLAVGGKA